MSLGEKSDLSLLAFVRPDDVDLFSNLADGGMSSGMTRMSFDFIRFVTRLFYTRVW
jgi:hypothetical protein